LQKLDKENALGPNKVHWNKKNKK